MPKAKLLEWLSESGVQAPEPAAPESSAAEPESGAAA